MVPDWYHIAAYVFAYVVGYIAGRVGLHRSA